MSSLVRYLVAFVALSTCACHTPARAQERLGQTAAQKSGPAALLRFPDIHDDLVVFSHAEDLWTASVDGGSASRLTIHDGQERFPKFSPDGTQIAFSAEYDGNGDVYVMNQSGGRIRRVTYHPGYDEVVGWHPLSGKIMFRSNRDSFSRFDRLFLIEPNGTGLERLILNEAAAGSFSPDGQRIAYNKVSRENRTWKRYRGGTAQDVYVYDLTSNALSNLTNHPGTDRVPMWIDDRVVFSSDRDRMLNLYSADPATGTVTQLTRHTDYDVRRPSNGGTRVVYEVGGQLWVCDVADGTARHIPIVIDSDRAEARPRRVSVGDYVTSVRCSPTGKRAVVVARGDVFTVPREHGATRNLTRSPGARDKDAVWSPDGNSIAYISDRSGEYELYVTDAGGQGQATVLTTHADGYRHTLRWSPDSQYLAYADHTLRCFVLEIATRKITEVDHAEYENVDVALDRKPIHDFAWSPDSRFVAYSKMNSDLLYQVHVFNLDSGTRHAASSGQFNDFGPAFTSDGKHLLFVSNRRFDPTYCDFEWEMVYKSAAGIYALTLENNGEALLPPRSDEETADSLDDADPDAPPVRTTIDFEGLSERIEALPIPAGNYRQLRTSTGAIYYLNAKSGDFNHFEYRAKGPRQLMAFDMETRDTRTVMSGVTAYDLSSDGKHIAYRTSEGFGIVDGTTSDNDAKPLGTDGLTTMLDPVAEWTQIFAETWRMERDFYYDPAMHGLDWDAVRQRYARLLPALSCRQDLQYIIGELIGELNTSHTYVFGGDQQRHAERVNVGMLGADWDVAEGRYRLKKIYRVTDWTRGIVPPLSRPGVRVNKGDYVLSVDGESISADRNIYSYFQNLAGKQVTLQINDRPTNEGARTIVVTPLSSERDLRYLDWTEHNRRIAAQASNGRIGYLHLPDTYLSSAREFPKYFYGQTRKEGLIVDGRFNGGGLDPDIFLQRLDKRLLALWTRRHSHDQTTPFVVTTAHMACLTNRQAGSGGDMLPMEFKMRKMGPVIGTRTWGGLVGVSMFLSMIDGGGLTAPDYRIYDTAGEWIVENTGVQPDIEVELHPAEVARGEDAQLLKAIEVLLDKIENEPRKWPQHAPFPVDAP